jgi:chemotaxis protein methyltransferase CheR
MIDLSHVYFAGEDPPVEVRLEQQLPSRPTIPGARRLGVPGPQERRSPESEPSGRLSPLLAFILRQSGLDCEAYQPKALNRRLAACLRLLRATSEEAGLRALQRNPELVEEALSIVLIGVSEFFRDGAVFQHLRQVVLPEALEKSESVRVYSAGCSAGHELYSVAMMLDELGALERSQLLGVDCRSDAIEQAGNGTFAVSELKGLEAGRRERYFRLEGPRAFISPCLRQTTTWRVADFGVFWGAEPWDLILFRNGAIYLEAEHANRVWRWLDEQLKPGGAVVTGGAERPPEDLHWKRESAYLYWKALN